MDWALAACLNVLPTHERGHAWSGGLGAGLVGRLRPRPAGSNSEVFPIPRERASLSYFAGERRNRGLSAGGMRHAASSYLLLRT